MYLFVSETNYYFVSDQGSQLHVSPGTQLRPTAMLALRKIAALYSRTVGMCKYIGDQLWLSTHCDSWWRDVIPSTENVMSIWHG